MDDSEVESTASILASVKEQEAQFEKLTRALEEERRHVSAQLERVRVSPQDANPLMANGTLTRRHQNGRFVGDADLERQKFSDLKLNGPQDHSHLLYSTIPRMQEPGQIVETYTEEDPEGAMSVVSVETSDDGTTRRTETTVKKVVKTVTTRTVQPIPMGPDGLPVDASSVSNNYIQTLGRDYRKNGNGGPGPYVGQAGTATLPRNFHYPHDGYGRHYEDGYPGGGDNYGSLSRVTRIDERYRPSMEGYRAPSRQDVYGPQPQVRVGGSSVDLHRFHPEPYGLEDDQRSMGYDDLDYIPQAERYQEAPPTVANNTGPHAASCFGAKKGKDEWFSRGKKPTEDPANDAVDFPKRTTPARGYELLFQPEVVRIYISLLRESKTPAILEASAGAIQNLCAGRWTYGRYIRSALRQEKALSAIADLLTNEHERVVKAASGALRNLAVDARNKELIGKHAIPNLVKNLPGGQQSPSRNFSEDTVVYKKPDREEIQMSSMGSNTKSLDNNYSTLNERGDHNRTLDRSGDLGDMEPLKGAPLMPDEGQESLDEELDVLVLDDEGDQMSYPPMQKI
ncbi:PREDICTED: catenin delta-1 [Elephantulus edwardii]|uniref:catenin delta-1 n=1 Tax=Elephantulus edwardii TaxID=28737 RepID=UPI0003F0597E|nr:PREDICTED: catenin delta-1 [Elephantulus edwardii]